MKINELEKMLLRRQSGELSTPDQKRLEAVLASDPAAREDARKLDALRDTWQQATAATPLPGPASMLRIRQAAENARNHAGKAGRLIPFPLQPVGIAMAAAAAAMVLGATLFLARWSPTASNESKIAELSPVDSEIEAALEAIDNSMLALLDVPADDVEALLGNDS